MSKHLSYSAWKKYHMCPRMYDLHYNKRLRSPGTTSALLFGTAMGDAMDELYSKEKVDPVEVFREKFKWEDCQNCDWDSTDFDPDLFTKERLDMLEDYEWEQKCWASMRIKGRLLIEEYMETIHPKILKVYSVQRSLKERPGFLDIECDIEGYNGKITIDFKTAKRPYTFDQVKNSTQLSLYNHHVKNGLQGFLVFNKIIGKDRDKKCIKCGFDGSGRSHKTCFNTDKKGKRCNGVWDETVGLVPKIQLLVDKVDTRIAEGVEKSILATEELIKTGHYPCNYESCNWQYGRQCVYKRYCFEGKKDGLEYKEPEDVRKK